MQSEGETSALAALADEKADDHVDDLEDDQGHDHVVDEDSDDTDYLIDHLAGIAFDQSGGTAKSLDGEYAGEDGAGRATDGVHAEGIERVVVAEEVLEAGAAPVTDNTGGDADSERA